MTFKNEHEFKYWYTQEQRDSLWQYFIDHSTIQKNGYYGVLFYIQNEDDFYRRLFYRYSKQFSRYDKEEKRHVKDMQFVHYYKYLIKRNSKIAEDIRKGNNYWKKLLLYLNKKTKTYLFEKKKPSK